MSTVNPLLGQKLKVTAKFGGFSVSPTRSNSIHRPFVAHKALHGRSKVYNPPKATSEYIFIPRDYTSRSTGQAYQECEQVPQYAAVYAGIMGMITSPNVVIPKTRVVLQRGSNGLYYVHGTLSKQVTGYVPAELVDRLDVTTLSKRDFASLVCATFVLGDDDSHDGNWGFDSAGRIVRIDYDRFGFHDTARFKGLQDAYYRLEDLKKFPNSCFDRRYALQITPEDINNFPLLVHYRPSNWFYEGNGGYEYVKIKFAELSRDSDFKKWKWFYFTKMLLIDNRQFQYHANVNCLTQDFADEIYHDSRKRFRNLMLALSRCPEYLEYLENISESDIQELHQELEAYDQRYQFRSGVVYKKEEINTSPDYRVGVLRIKYQCAAFSKFVDDIKARIAEVKEMLIHPETKEQALIEQIQVKTNLLVDTRKAIKQYQIRRDEVKSRLESRREGRISSRETPAIKLTAKEHDLEFIDIQTDHLSEYTIELFDNINKYIRELLEYNPAECVGLIEKLVLDCQFDIRDDEDKEDYIDIKILQIAAYLELGNYESCKISFRHLDGYLPYIKKDIKKFLEFHLLLGKYYYHTNQHALAVVCFDKIIKLIAPKVTDGAAAAAPVEATNLVELLEREELDIKLLLAESYYKSGQPQQAIEHYLYIQENLMISSAINEQIKFYLVKSYVAQECYAQALAVAEDITDKDTVIEDLILCHVRLGNYPQALELINNSIRLTPDVKLKNKAIIHMYYGQALAVGIEQFQQGLENIEQLRRLIGFQAFRRHKELFTLRQDILLNLAKGYLKNNNIVEAKEIIDQVNRPYILRNLEARKLSLQIDTEYAKLPTSQVAQHVARNLRMTRPSLSSSDDETTKDTAHGVHVVTDGLRKRALPISKVRRLAEDIPSPPSAVRACPYPSSAAVSIGNNGTRVFTTEPWHSVAHTIPTAPTVPLAPVALCTPAWASLPKPGESIGLLGARALLGLPTTDVKQGCQ